MNAPGGSGGSGAGPEERAGAGPRDPLLALDPWLLFLLGMVVALQVTGDPAFSTPDLKTLSQVLDAFMKGQRK